jgi:dTDP-4-amino-4,6-dideoxygalactose transaminase
MIPYLDLKTQYLGIKEEIGAAISRVLDSTQYALGPEVQAFEAEFASLCGVSHGVAVNSGTSALHLALLAAGIGRGDEVITVSFTFVATAAAVRYAGATPVFVDIDPVTFTIDPDAIERAITPRTKAIVPVHLYGQAADMDPILAIARRHGLTVIEDACQAHAATYKGRPVGSLGDMACFSFYPGKNLGAYGEGGIVVTNDAAATTQMRILRDWGQKERYHHVVQGFNYRMDGIQGAILRVKLRHLPEWTALRRAWAARYDDQLQDAGVATPAARAGSRHVYHIYAVRSSDREDLRQRLQGDGIATGLHYPIPVHLQPAHADLGYGPGDLPHTERAASEVLSLPMYPELTAEQVDTVAAAVRRHAPSPAVAVASPMSA